MPGTISRRESGKRKCPLVGLCQSVSENCSRVSLDEGCIPEFIEEKDRDDHFSMSVSRRLQMSGIDIDIHNRIMKVV